jgi:hypothetical protein
MLSGLIVAGSTVAAGAPVAQPWPAPARIVVPLSIAVEPFRAPASRRAALIVVLGADFPPRHEPRPPLRALTVHVSAFDDRGESIVERQHDVLLPSAMFAAAGNVRDGLVSRIDVPPGRYRIQAGLRDATGGLAGTASTIVEVPDFVGEPLTLSGVLLRRQTPLEVSASPIDDLVPFTPTAERAFASAERVLAHLRVYQGGDDMMRPVQVAARITGAEGRTVFQQALDVPADWFGIQQVSEYELALPLEGFEAGDYLLTIEATLRDIRRSRDVRFTVR